MLAAGDFLWQEDYWDDVPPPTTRAELAALKEDQQFWDEGTHTILDMDRIVSSTDDTDDDGTIRQLSSDELTEYFGTDRPSEAEFERVYRQFGPILDDIRRWTGRCAVLYYGEKEQKIAFYGVSGD